MPPSLPARGCRREDDTAGTYQLYLVCEQRAAALQRGVGIVVGLQLLPPRVGPRQLHPHLAPQVRRHALQQTRGQRSREEPIVTQRCTGFAHLLAAHLGTLQLHAQLLVEWES